MLDDLVEINEEYSRMSQAIQKSVQSKEREVKLEAVSKDVSLLLKRRLTKKTSKESVKTDF